MTSEVSQQDMDLILKSLRVQSADAVEWVAKIIADGVGCWRECEKLVGPDVYCGCRKDAKQIVETIVESTMCLQAFADASAEGSFCPNPFCIGTLEYDFKDPPCTCHLGHAPCSACENRLLSCSRCGLSAGEHYEGCQHE